LGIRAAKGQSERGTGGFPPLGFYPLGDAERQVWLQRWRPIDTSTSPASAHRPTRRHVYGPRAVTRTSDYWIQLETTPQPFGGRRWWFICPRTGVRAAKLYLPNGAFTFASRQTYRLVYHSQREAPHDRALRRAFKLRANSERKAASATTFRNRSGCAGRPTTGSSRKSMPPRRSSTPIYWGSSKSSSAVRDDETHLLRQGVGACVTRLSLEPPPPTAS
jgi:hypothetical protein